MLHGAKPTYQQENRKKKFGQVKATMNAGSKNEKESL